MKVLITGGKGFIGSHVTKKLIEKGHEVIIGTRRSPVNSNEFFFELNSLQKIEENLKEINPQAIIHLSAKASVGGSFAAPFETYESNIQESINLLKVISKDFKNIRTIIASSAEVYKSSENALSETSVLDPVSPYGYTKNFIDYFSRFLNLNLVVTRLFNSIGPGQSDTYVMSNFAKQIVEMKLGIRDKILKVGNIEVQRDFLDVRDVAEAYSLLLLGTEKNEAYNICSGNSLRISEVVNFMIDFMGVTGVKIEVDPKRLRSSEIQKIQGSYEKINKAYGWSPSITLRQTIFDILNYWEEKLK